jgi:hypothetical protein
MFGEGGNKYRFHIKKINPCHLEQRSDQKHFHVEIFQRYRYFWDKIQVRSSFSGKEQDSDLLIVSTSRSDPDQDPHLNFVYAFKMRIRIQGLPVPVTIFLNTKTNVSVRLFYAL